ncbi:MAG: YceI family protein [Alphaproteobacteria bacterium]|nr:YceI family protein [Alphaproteobacteria bacterium]MCD8570490.1 YceI family protein [Alphaproteobacteria bacterium]
MKKLLLTTSALIALSFTAGAAQAETYTVDPSHTNILMNVSHLGFSTMVLEALKPEGTITFDQAKPEEGKVEITMKAIDIDGDDEKFNTHLQSADFFNAEKFATITFKSTKVEVTGANTGKVTGDFTLLGVTKPVTLDVTFNKAGANPFSQKETVGFTASGSIKRSDFGMGYGLPMIGDEVALNINLEAVKP